MNIDGFCRRKVRALPEEAKAETDTLKFNTMTLSDKIAELKRLNEVLEKLEDEIVDDIKNVVDLSSPTAKDEVRKLIPFSSFVKDLIYMEINKIQKQ